MLHLTIVVHVFNPYNQPVSVLHIYIYWQREKRVFQQCKCVQSNEEVSNRFNKYFKWWLWDFSTKPDCYWMFGFGIYILFPFFFIFSLLNDNVWNPRGFLSARVALRFFHRNRPNIFSTNGQKSNTITNEFQSLLGKCVYVGWVWVSERRLWSVTSMQALKFQALIRVYNQYIRFDKRAIERNVSMFQPKYCNVKHIIFRRWYFQKAPQQESFATTTIYQNMFFLLFGFSFSYRLVWPTNASWKIIGLKNLFLENCCYY